MANEPLKTAVLTDIGKAKLDAAYQAGEKIIITEMALGDSNLAYVVPDPTFTELVNEFGRQVINEGNTTDSWINALVYVDSAQFAGEAVWEFGLYDDEGDMIIYSSYVPSLVPAIGQDYIQLEIECSVDLYNASTVTIEVTPILPQATELERGIAKVATDADVAAGVDDEKIVTAKKLATVSLFGPYRADKVYQCGEVCYTVNNGKFSCWEWYSNVESLAGKDPLDTNNRQSGWSDETKPFYWTPYKKARSGTPLWPWMSMTFPEGTLNVIGNSVPTVVFWRLAEVFPEFVNEDTGMIDFPENGGEFLRVLDQGRGVDIERSFGSWQPDELKAHAHTQTIPDRTDWGGGSSWARESMTTAQTGVTGGNETRPRNLAFPILVEV